MRFLVLFTTATMMTAAFLCRPVPACAEIEKQLQFESDPAGAQVFMLEGTRRISLGTTPFRHAVEFHSEYSVLRFAFEKSGYASKTVEVSADKNRVSAALTRRALGADPKDITDPLARKIQEKINPILTSALPRLLEQKGGWAVDIEGTARVRNQDGHLWLALPLRLNGIPDSLKESGADRGEELAKSYGREFCKRLLAALEAELPKTLSLSAIMIETRMDSVAHGFGVSSHVEMECVSGYDQVYRYNPCAYVGANGVCQGRDQLVSIYNPCKSKISKVKIDPTASVATTHERVLAMQQMGKGKGDVSLLYMDADGKILYREGTIPDALAKPGK